MPRSRAAVRLARSFGRTALSSGRRWWIGGAVVVVLAAAVLGRDDLALMARSFAGADWHWAVLALVLMLASLALRSLALQVIVNALDAGRARLRDAFSATSIGLLANSLIPIKVGTVLSPYVLFVLLRRRGAQAAFPTILGVTLTERMFAIATFLALSLAFLGTLDVPAWAVNVLLVCAGADHRPVRRRHRLRAPARAGSPASAPAAARGCGAWAAGCRSSSRASASCAGRWRCSG